ncbi:hypothetical protein R1sor_027078 [Riccia sorocarpa]|uniref:Uncharacterized protein n=1 Tax=Riccia sorocarpa TaxID=122646 RepID=A0ABD3GD88_9MARC
MSSIVEEYLWQAARKKWIVAIVAITLLPVFLPVVLIFSVILLTSALPLICGIAAVYYLQKYARVLIPFHLAAADSAATVYYLQKYARVHSELEKDRLFAGVAGGVQARSLAKNFLEFDRLYDGKPGKKANPGVYPTRVFESKDRLHSQQYRTSVAGVRELWDRSLSKDFLDFDLLCEGQPGKMKSRSAAPVYRTGVFESDDQLHTGRCSIGAGKSSSLQADPHALGQANLAKLRHELRSLHKVHDERIQEQLKRESKAVKIAVCNRETRDSPLTSKVEYSSRIGQLNPRPGATA